MQIEGVEYTPEAVLGIRKEVLIPLRDLALDQGEMHIAVALTHVIVYMQAYAEKLEEVWK